MSKKTYPTRQVAAIEHGTVIDHLDPKTTFDVLKILDFSDELITVGNNLDSSKIGKKGVIKIAGKQLSEQQLSRIALLSPNAKAAVIKDFQVVQKMDVKVPDMFEGVLKCGNPLCITRNEQTQTRFFVIKAETIKLRCYHCERTFDKDEIGLI